jgi:Ser/Thr protein kinase RdoA (MazF antagonist)
MHLNVANLAHFLIGRGLLPASAIVGGDLTILDSSRRNRNFKVIRRAEPGLFVKQMRDMQADAMLTLRREAACYELARDDPMLSRLMPRLITYDAGRHVLVVELLPDAESLADYHAREKTFPTEIGRMLGEGLGLYHAHAGALLQNEALQALLARQVPVILSLERGGLTALGQVGRIGPALSSLIAQHRDFQALLDALGAEWRCDSLLHGDMKWDNVLVFPTQAGLDFRIVDWEMADFGDAAWDVGAVLQSFLAVWILSMPIASGLPPESYVGMAAQPLETMRPVLRSFWQSYAATRGFAEDQRKAELERSMRFGAARLVWAALEQRLFAPQLDPAATALLQVSMNVLQNPARAVTELLDV